jgi:magnesium chelatase subunit D
VVGQEEAGVALILTALDPGIGGVLLRGDKGSAKSTLARGLAALLPDYAPFVELPLGATEDRVLGSLDLRAALHAGDVERFRPGLLAAADGGVLYVDEVNLLPDHLVDALLDAAASGVHRVERDGVSHEHPARFVLVGSMNPEEGELRPQLLDRFGLAVEVRAPDDPEVRAEAVRRRLDHDAGHPVPDTDDQLRQRLASARPAVIPDTVVLYAARVAAGVGAESLRADLVLCRAAAALASWEGRPAATEDDVARVAPLALGHRRRRRPFDPPTLPEEELQAALDQADEQQDADAVDADDDTWDPPDGGGWASAAAGADRRRDSGGHATPPAGYDLPGDRRAEDGAGTGRWTAGSEQPGSDDDTAEIPPDPGAPFRPDAGRSSSAGSAGDTPPGPPNGAPPAASAAPSIDGTADLMPPPPTGGSRSAPPEQRWDELAGDSMSNGAAPLDIGAPAPRRAPPSEGAGRAVGAQVPGANGPDGLAVLPTVRAAVQRRATDPSGPVLDEADLREPRRVRAKGRVVVIAVDTSGSMGTAERVAAATGAVMGLLADAYLRRDKVALVAFRGDGATEVLPPTASVELARAHLAELETGGPTPLAEGIVTALATAQRAAIDGVSPLLVLLTDGRATGSAGALDRALKAAELVQAAGVEAVVLDAEDDGGERLELAASLAEAMGGRTVRLSAVSAATVEIAIRKTLTG